VCVEERQGKENHIQSDKERDTRRRERECLYLKEREMRRDKDID
jgi:hypothetical protein